MPKTKQIKQPVEISGVQKETKYFEEMNLQVTVIKSNIGISVSITDLNLNPVISRDTDKTNKH